MKPIRGRGRCLYPLLVLVAALVVVIAVSATAAQGATSAFRLPPSTVQQSSFEINAADLGDFAGQPPAVQSPSAIVINMSTGKVLYEHNAHKVRPMASTTKIMTGILVLENMALDERVDVSAKAAATSEPVPFLKEGDVFTVEQMLYALLLRSANSSAVALAEACSGSEEKFVSLMNEKAAELGMKDTHFVNPSGLDAKGHQSTAADMAVLARYAMQNDTFREIVSTETYELPLPGRKAITCESTNKLLGAVNWVIGVKTGLTPKAEQCFVGAGSKDGVNIISVVLGQPSTDLCFRESKALMEYGFSQYRFATFLKRGEVVAEAEVPYQLDGRVQLATASPVAMELHKDDSVTVSVDVERPLQLPVAAGEVFGKVNVTLDGETVQSVDLVAKQSYGKTTLGSKVTYLWQRLGRALGRIF